MSSGGVGRWAGTCPAPRGRRRPRSRRRRGRPRPAPGGRPARAARRPSAARPAASTASAASSIGGERAASSRLAGGQQPPERRPRGSPSATPAGPADHAVPPLDGVAGPSRPELPVARQLPPGRGTCSAPDRTTLVGCLEPRPPTRFAYLGPEGTFAEAALSSAVASSEGAAVAPSPSVAGRAGRRPIGRGRRRAGAAGELRRGLGARHDGRPGRRRPAGDHPRGVPRRWRSSSPSGPGTALSDVRTVASHPHALAQTRRLAGRATCPGVTAAAGELHRRRRPQAVAGGRVRRRRLRADRRPALRARRRSSTTSPTTRARSPGSCWCAGPGQLPAPTGNDKTSLVAVVGDRTGALLEVLQRVRRPRDQPDPHRVAAHPRAARRLLVLARLRGPRRRPPGGRGAGRAAPGLRRRPLPRLLPARRRAAEPAGRPAAARRRVRRRRRLARARARRRGDLSPRAFPPAPVSGPDRHSRQTRRP